MHLYFPLAFAHRRTVVAMLKKAATPITVSACIGRPQNIPGPVPRRELLRLLVRHILPKPEQARRCHRRTCLCQGAYAQACLLRRTYILSRILSRPFLRCQRGRVQHRKSAKASCPGAWLPYQKLIQSGEMSRRGKNGARFYPLTPKGGKVGDRGVILENPKSYPLRPSIYLDTF